MPKFTLFTTVLDGEPLLPYWLEHHRRLFDHGVITLYPCKDNSEQIIREMVPKWEVLAPIHEPEYSCAGADQEVMTQEAKHGEWKMALNVTEFAATQNLAEVVKSVPKGVRCIIPYDAAVMIDTITTANIRLNPDRSLLLQKHHGLFSKDYKLWRCRHQRQLHCATHGDYDVGRHNSKVTPKGKSPLLYVSWFVWSPYRDIRQRKLEVQEQLSCIDVKVKRGWQHMVSPEKQDDNFRKLSVTAYDLHRNDGYRAAAGRAQ